MNVLVERYQRRKYVNQEDSQVLYYVRHPRVTPPPPTQKSTPRRI